MIRRGRQTDQELGLGARRHEQLNDPLANDRVLAEQRGEFAQEPFRARRSMIFSPIRKRVDELTLTHHSAASARRAAPFRRFGT